MILYQCDRCRAQEPISSPDGKEYPTTITVELLIDEKMHLCDACKKQIEESYRKIIKTNPKEATCR